MGNELLEKEKSDFELSLLKEQLKKIEDENTLSEFRKKNEELKNKKLDYEVSLLADQVNEKKKPPSNNKVAELLGRFERWYKRWYPLWLIVTAIGGGLYSYFSTIEKYLDQRTKSHKIVYDAQLLQAAGELNSDTPFEQKKAMLILSSSGLDALDFIFAKLETSAEEKQWDEIYDGLYFLRERLSDSEKEEFDVKLSKKASQFLSMYLDANNVMRKNYFNEAQAYAYVIHKFCITTNLREVYEPVRKAMVDSLQVHDLIIKSMRQSINLHDSTIYEILNVSNTKNESIK